MEQSQGDFCQSPQTELKESKSILEKLKEYHVAAKKCHEDIEVVSKELTATLLEAKSIKGSCEEVLRASTNVALAASFEKRAKDLTRSRRLWTAALILALIFGVLISTARIQSLADILSGYEVRWAVIFVHILLAAISVGAPLWFAWVATKQISHLFKLSEDYAFKAAVATAYEGYRRDSSNIDNLFVSILFGSTPDRVEESPMRFIDELRHGGSINELLASNEFKYALENNPKLYSMLKNLSIKKQGSKSNSSVKETVK